MTSLFIFAGTSEGRELSERLSQSGFDCTVSVATEYGACLLPKSENLTVLHGRLSHEEMARLFREKNYAFVIDATHPFATEVSKEIKKACDCTQNRYIRLARDTDFEKMGTAVEKNGTDGEHSRPPASENDETSDFFYFDDIVSAGEWLESEGGKIFVTTGSKELPLLSEKISDKARLFVRVLPSIESLEICSNCGISPRQIIAMQGPFSQKMNEIQFEESGAEILLTKETGNAGGFFEKIHAAKKVGMKIAVIQNPEKRAKVGQGREVRAAMEIFYSVDAVVEKLRELKSS